MQRSMSRSNPIITGTVLLTAAGILSKIMGFYYRIFLTGKIGAEGMGIYQLIFPVFIIGFSFSCVGIETSMSRMIAKNGDQPSKCFQILLLSTGCCLGLSLFVTLLCRQNADWIASRLLHAPECAGLIRILSLSFLPAGLHSCINGYYYGQKKTTIPAISQLVEQMVRIGGVFLLFELAEKNHATLESMREIGLVTWGLCLGEAASALLSLTSVATGKQRYQKGGEGRLLHELFAQAIPLTANRLVTTLLQSGETLLFPLALCRGGLARSQALSMLGTLSGMAMPLVLFPSALTNSLSVLLVPHVAEGQEKEGQQGVRRALEATLQFSLFLGIFSMGYFLTNGMGAGLFLFRSRQAGEYVCLLSFICPFYYVYATMGSVLHGLGKTMLYFGINVTGLLFRIAFLWFFGPLLQIRAYVFGMLLSLIFGSLTMCLCLRKEIGFHVRMGRWIGAPLLCHAAGASLTQLTDALLGRWFLLPRQLSFSANSLVYCIPFLLLLGKMAKKERS